MNIFECAVRAFPYVFSMIPQRRQLVANAHPLCVDLRQLLRRPNDIRFHSVFAVLNDRAKLYIRFIEKICFFL